MNYCKRFLACLWFSDICNRMNKFNVMFDSKHDQPYC